MTSAQIKTMRKGTYKAMIKENIENNCMKYLNERKSSKTSRLKHTSMQIKNYLKPNNIIKNKEEAQLIFKSRSRMLDVKCNMKGNYLDLSCGICGIEDETQEHILRCITATNTEHIDYDMLFQSNIKDQLKVANQLIENINIKNIIMI